MLTSKSIDNFLRKTANARTVIDKGLDVAGTVAGGIKSTVKALNSAKPVYRNTEEVTEKIKQEKETGQ